SYCIFPRRDASDNTLCGACVDGYIPWGTKCDRCPGTNVGLFCAGVLLSFALVLFLLRTSGTAAGTLAVLIYFLQTAALEIGSASQWLTWLHLANLGANSSSTCL